MNGSIWPLLLLCGGGFGGKGCGDGCGGNNLSGLLPLLLCFGGGFGGSRPDCGCGDNCSCRK